MSRLGKIRRKARAFFLHAALVISSLFFALPFLWLLGTSCKVADEMLPVRWLPRIPPEVLQSSYIALRDNDHPAPPPMLSEADWQRLRPWIDQAMRSRLLALLPTLPPALAPALDREELRDGLLLRLLRRAPEDLFSRPEAALSAWFAEGIDPNLVREVFDTIYRRMAISEVVFRATDVMVEERIPGEVCPWRVLSGEAELKVRSDGSSRTEREVRYSFEKVRYFELQALVPLSMRPEELDKVLVAYRADRSWHRITCSLEIEGKRYVAARPAFLSTDLWQETMWRIPRAQAPPMNMRTWLWLEETGSTPFAEKGKARITFRVDYCPRWRAALNKLANNYREVLRFVPVPTYFKNSAILVSANILGQVLASSLVAFAFARLRWPSRDFCFMLMLATLMIPPQVTLIPQFLIFKALGWYNTLTPLWIGAFFGSPFFIFLLRQFMRGIPTDLEDSAKIDGSGYFGIYWNIILPLVKPALATIGIFTFLGTWNDFMGPLIYLNDQQLYPLSMGVFALQVFQVGNYGLMLAASVLMTLPVILLFFFAQRHFIEGITLTGLKG